MADDNSDSDSDYESLHSAVHHHKALLHPLTPFEIQDPNEWPCFLLEQACIYDKHGKRVNLLEVGIRGPFKATGRLSFEGDDGSLRARLIKPGFRDGGNITITDITQYSFGSRSRSSDSTHVALWAGETRYGWFELVPAPDYEIFYLGTLQAINTLYFFQALFKRKGAKDMKIEELLLKYTAREGSGMTRREMEARIKGNAEFLLRQMMLKEDGDITKTAFFGWLANERKDVIADLKKRNISVNSTPFLSKTKSVHIAPPPLLVNTKPALEPHEPDENERQDWNRREMDYEETEVTSLPSSAQLSHDSVSPPPTDTSYPVFPPKTDIPGTVLYLMELHRLGRGRKPFGGMDKITFAKIAGYLYLECSFPIHQYGNYILLFHRDAIIKRLPAVWQNSGFHRDLLVETVANIDSRTVGSAEEKVRWRAGVQALTELNLRKQMATPRHTSSMGPRSKSKNKNKLPGSGLDSNRNTPVARAVASTRTGSTSRAATPPIAATSSRRTTQAKPTDKLKEPQGSYADILLTGKDKIRNREAENRKKITSGEGVTPPPPLGKKPTRTIKYSGPQAGGKRDFEAMDLDSPSPDTEAEDDWTKEKEPIEPVFLTLTSRESRSRSPTASVAVVSAEAKALGHRVDHLTDHLMKMGRERERDGEREVIAGRVAPKTIRRAFQD